MADYGDNFDDYVIANSSYCYLGIGFQLSFPKCGIGDSYGSISHFGVHNTSHLIVLIFM